MEFNYNMSNFSNNSDEGRHPPMSKLSGISVQVRKDNIDQAIRTLKKKMIEENVIKDYQKKEEFVPGTMVRRKREAEARRRWQKYLRMRDQTSVFK